MTIADDYNRLKAEHEAACRKAERARGALDQLLTQLQREFGLGSLNEAKATLEKMQTDLAKAERKAEKLMSRFVEKWAESLGLQAESPL